MSGIIADAFVKFICRIVVNIFASIIGPKAVVE